MVGSGIGAVVVVGLRFSFELGLFLAPWLSGSGLSGIAIPAAWIDWSIERASGAGGGPSSLVENFLLVGAHSDPSTPTSSHVRATACARVQGV